MGINMITTIPTISNKFIDIHSHILHCVDDGSRSLESSILYLKQAQKIGIKKIICTPHMSTCNISRINTIKQNFLILREESSKLGIELYLGTEILITENTIQLFKENKMRSLDGSKYILVEVKRNEKTDIENIIYLLEELMDLGYIPILAHLELYSYYRDIDIARRLKESGILLQIDSTSLFKKTSNKKIYKFTSELLSARLVDFVASDTHCTIKRSYKSYKDAYKKIKRKYGLMYADMLFKSNPGKILKD